MTMHTDIHALKPVQSIIIYNVFKYFALQTLRSTKASGDLTDLRKHLNIR